MKMIALRIAFLAAFALSFESVYGGGAEWADVFQHVDTNNDGRISLGEMKVFLHKVKENFSDDAMAEFFAQLDIDQDGSLDLNEFTQFMESDSAESLKEAFNVFDKNQDGLISPEELQEVLGAMGHSKSYDEAKQMVQAFDSDNDGFVNFEEFLIMMSPKN